ncbi:MAG: PKD domain-containing protein [Daejeonella sp.]|uniref:PKD domain-containing protein n=1 Tax=Daejeonella sp. TaxID=2805397 RepID=UPI002736B9D6|nr:PKD domain-containing protein [Daejeonella sp.]MDP3467220.1 PKD domain-containing protein [Daejeonella sp.]
MFRRIYYIFFLTLFTWLCGFNSLHAQSVSNEGTEFWAVFPTHVPASLANGFRPLARYSIFITGKQASSGTVTVGGSSLPFVLPAGNTVIEVPINRGDAYIDELEAGRVLSNRAIRVQVDPGKPKVVVYGHIFAGARSAASLILPKEALGQQYYSMNYLSGNTRDGGQNHIVLIASEPNTKIFIRLNGRDLIAGGVNLVNPGDVYEFLSNEDLTGANVFVDPETSGCKQFAMFSGTTNSAIFAPSGCVGDVSSDPLYQQNYPVDSWGKSYGFIPFSSRSPRGTAVRTRGNYVRILAKENGTRVTYNGTQVANLNAGQYYQTPVPVNEPAYISANNAIAVAQYSLTQACAGGGFSDPDMVILNPIEYNIKNITVYSSNRENISENYVNILIKTTAAASFRINGRVPGGTFTALRNNPEYSYLQLNLNQYPTQIFNLSATDGFNAIAYGFGDVESYAYSAGTNLASSQFVRAINKITLEEITSACTRQDLDFKLTLTAPASSLIWQLDANELPVTQNNPEPVELVRNGITFFEYLFPKDLGYSQPGQKSIKIIAKYATLAGCNLEEQEIDYQFDVFDPPEPSFSYTSNFCTNAEISFTDGSKDNGNPITSWEWDFGDGKTSIDQNPKHIFMNPGSYNVVLKVKNSTSCDAKEFPQTIVISASPVADFSNTSPGCENAAITFTDLSRAVQGNIVKWEWNFGDGESVVRNISSPITHQYTSGGQFMVSLKVTNELGCENVLSRELNLTTPFLEAGQDTFILRGGSVRFNVQATGTNLKYKWTPSIGLDRDDIKNPTASPTSDMQYFVTVSSDEGCILEDNIQVKVLEMPVIPNTFTPNGDGINDVWNIEYLDSYPGVSVTIFNRFGIKVFGSIGYLKAWDGILNGQVLPVGTYYYVIDPKIGIPVFKGWVTVIR